MLKSEAAAYLAGVTQTEGAEASAPTNLHVITGEVGEASADGKTLVKIDGLMFSESDDQFIEVDALGGLEEGDIATIVLTGEQGHAMTPLALGSIGSVDRITVRIAAIEADYIKVEQLDAAEARIGELEADHVSVDDLDAATARIGTLETTRATITDLEAATARIGDLEADHVSTDDLNAATARIGTLEADHVSTDDLNAAKARIGTLETNTADIGTIRANSAKVQNLTAAELEADHATVGSLSTTYATIANLNAANGRITNLESTKANISDLEADYITADEIEATYMHANMSNSDVAWIQNGTIKDGAIVSAMINDVSANKLTAGTINGSVINVTNLNADNITTGTINGQRIGEGSLSLSKLEDDVYTESEVDAKLATMQAEIDGAIETWTGTSVPTLNNSPASNWTTAAVRDTHVGDVYFVVNSQSQQNGYNYRFTKSGSTYSWQLIKDSDVTNALQRLETAEGKITTFDSDISTLKTDTGSLTTRTTNLETRMSDAEDDILDKVDTTTFNEVSDTVDQHSQTISQHTTAISNKADSSTVTAVTNRVSKNEQDISGINTTIGELQDTLETKADGSTVSTISNKLNTVSDTVDGHTQTLTSVQNTLSTKADSSTVSTLTTKVNTISDTVDGHTSQLSSITTTQTTIQSTLDKTVKSSIQLWYSKANTTAPSKPTSQVTSTSTSGNAWRIVVPAYNASYPHYYYCWQYEYVDGTYGWSAVVRDIAMGESQSTARTADSNASAAVTTANTANTNASTALTTANTANTNASDAKTAAATASTTASEAKTTAETAASDASTAKTNAASAVSTANSASTTATNAQSTANANIKSSVQLWFTKANSTAPNKPTSVISTSNANTANAWNLVVPVWNKNYPHYFYCYQQQKGDGNYQWTDVVYDRATSEAQQLANTTSTNLSTLQTNYATFKQQTEQFESTVGTTYATKTELKGATDDITALESRVSTNETSISNNTSAIALKANSSDVYTKTAVDGKITQEVSDRNAAITAKANEITSTVSETYATKTELGEAVDNRVVVDGEFLHRITGGEQDVPSGRATVQSIKGKTLAWNQLAQLPFGYNQTLKGITFTRSGDGMTFSGTSTGIVYNQIYTQGNNSLYTKVGHVYYVCKRGTGIEDVQIYNDNGGIRLKDASSAIGTANAEKRWYFLLDSGLTVDGYAVVNIIDLTQMFGAGNEPATVAEFETMFPEPYYPYDAGSLLPVRMEGVETVGFNLLDLSSPRFGGNYNKAVGASMTGDPSNVSGENPCILVVTSAWGGVTYVAEVLSGQRYHSQTTFAADASGNTRVTEYLLDSEFKVTRRLGNYSQNYTINHDITVQDGERYYAISYSISAAGTMTLTDTIINLSDPARNGEYEPYWHSERPIPASTYFPNGMRSAGSVYDELTENEAVTRVGSVDLWTLNWSELSSPGSHVWRVDTSQFPATPKQVSSNALPVNAITIDYAVKAYAPLSSEDDKYFGIGNNRLSIIDHAYSTAEEFAASLSGKMMYYELATPVTTHIDPPLNLTYKVDSNGTERVLVDETQDAPQSAPLPMSVTYGVNLYESAGDDAASMASIESRVTTAESSITQNARNIELKVSETDVTGNYLVGKINLDSTTVKIDADRVEIDGTAVFSAISSDVDDAITSKGYQTSSQVNSAITSKGYQTSSQVESAITSKGYQTASQVSTAVTNGTANLATKANAVKRTQRIWYRKSASGAPATPGTASSNWVTKADDGNDAWTKMHIAISSTHKYIYTCEQYEMANGTVGYTSVLLDNTITVIDGGNIITGTVTANKLNAASINASKSLTVGAMTDAAASTILNSNVQVGGRNYLLNTENPSTSNQPKPIGDGITWGGAANMTLAYSDGVMKLTSASTSGEHYVRLNTPSHTQRVFEAMGVDPHDELVLSGYIRATMTSSNSWVTVRIQPDTGTSWLNTITLRNLLTGEESTNTSNVPILSASSTEWVRFAVHASIPESVAAVSAYFSFQQYGTFTVGDTIEFKRLKLEKGNKATDWTPAPEDMATAESLAGTNESLEGAITDIGELSDQLVGTVSEQNKTIATIQTYLNSLRKDLDAEIQSRQQWLNFNAAEGLVIGAAGSTFKTVTTNTSQQFRSGGTVLAETSGSEFVAPVMRSDQILIGNWMWTRRDNGNLSLKWIG